MDSIARIRFNELHKLIFNESLTPTSRIEKLKSYFNKLEETDSYLDIDASALLSEIKEEFKKVNYVVLFPTKNDNNSTKLKQAVEVANNIKMLKSKALNSSAIVLAKKYKK